METYRWAELPATLREQVDALVLRDRRFEAIKAIFNSGFEPRPSLLDAQLLVADRYRSLGDRIEFSPEPARDLATLIAKVEGMPRPPVAIEAEWDGDTQGWFVVLTAITAEPQEETGLAQIRHGGDIRIFNGQVPPWPEAEEAQTTGRALADHFGVPFRFASPDAPELS
ncbi:hypothetical protein [Actinoallomurus acanthiterrae]